MTSAADALEVLPTTANARRRRVLIFGWAVVGVVLLALKVGGTPTPEERAARDGWWLLTHVARVLLDLGALYGALRLVRGSPIGRGQPVRHMGLHVLLGLAYAISSSAVHAAYASSHGLAQSALLWTLFGNLVGFALWDGVAHAFEYFRRYRESETASLRLRVELADVGRRRAEAELRALRAELNPQMLGDALDTVAALARTDPARAEQTLVQLGDTMRAAIAPAPAHASPDAALEEELAALEPFLALQRARFGDRLVLEVDAADEALDARVPHLKLQTLVRHTVDRAMTRPGAAEVRITAARAGDRLRLVEGDGNVLLDLPWSADERDTGPSDSAPPAVSPRSVVQTLLLGAWFLLIFALGFAAALSTPMPSGADPTVVGSMLEALIAALTLTAMLYVAIRRARDPNPRPRPHVIAATGFGGLIACTKILFAVVVGFPYVMPTAPRFITSALVGMLAYALLAAAAHAVEYARRYRGSAATALRLEAEVADAARRRAEAQLRALKTELNPHFLGNALAAAASLVHSDVDAAQRVVSQLGLTLRAAVARLDTQEVTLREEIDALAPFLELERARLGDRLEVRWAVDDDALQGRVPHLILQPLVENAVKHGLLRGTGCVDLAARRIGDRLELSVRDNGEGINPRTPRRSSAGGVGLANVRSRLEELYGSGASVDLAPAPPPDTGTIARVSLPWRVG